MEDTQDSLDELPVRARVLLNGPIIVARDVVHMRALQHLDRHNALPEYFKRHPVLYGSPAKTPPGKPIGSIGPVTCRPLDAYVPRFHAAGGSLVTIGKGKRGESVRESCKKHNAFHLGAIGGTGAKLSSHVKACERVDMHDLGPEAVLKIEVENFPTFLMIDNKGNDFYGKYNFTPDSTKSTLDAEAEVASFTDIGHVIEWFEMLDQEATNYISVVELQVLGYSEEEATTLIANYDYEKTGGLNFDDFNCLVHEENDVVVDLRRRLEDLLRKLGPSSRYPLASVDV
jgi:tartrate/fumarate subfamily iron-sulfur-dependent hydro-lyase beta chain